MFGGIIIARVGHVNFDLAQASRHLSHMVPTLTGRSNRYNKISSIIRVETS
jgi:hypothetical protein